MKYARLKYIESKLDWVLFGLTLMSVLASAFYFGLSLFEFCNLPNGQRSAGSFYSIVAKRSGLYQFTLIVLAAMLALRQVRLVLGQNRWTEKDETLKQCNYFLTTIQESFKRFIDHSQYGGHKIEWTGIRKKLTRKDLMEVYPHEHESFRKIESDYKNEVLITLYMLDAFAARFIHGDLNIELAKKIIGDVYLKQVGLLMGMIAYFRTEGDENFFKSIIDLYDRWE